MGLAGILISLAVALVAWSQYRCYLLQERLSRCSEIETPYHRSQTEPPASRPPGPEPESPEEETPGARSRSRERSDRLSLEGGSSVWCKGTSNADRTCRFHNLCFSRARQDFVFLSGPRSVSAGLPQRPFSPALVDLSSVPDHNTQYFGYAHLPAEALGTFQRVEYLPGRHLLMNRFHPDNLMHVFHDDLLPLFFTLLEAGLMTLRDLSTDARLVLLDGHPPGEEYLRLYASLTAGRPLLRADLVGETGAGGDRGGGLLCFEEALVGLSNATTWYQYGFRSPQGPLADAQLTGGGLELFASRMRSGLGLDECRQSPDRALLLTRRSSRLILNEVELVERVARSTGMRVVTAGLEDHTVEELVALVSCAKVLIGMHGSLLVLSLFLPRGSLLVELYPYAVNPDHYTPYRTLVLLPGAGLAYRAWRNDDPERTVTHPEAAPSLGGIAHLAPAERRSIRSAAEVPRHLCCSDPGWLFRIFQDTVVDVPSVLRLISDGLRDANDAEDMVHRGPFYPGKVGGLSCSLSGTALLAYWEPPWNIEHLTKALVETKYELWVQGEGEDDYDAYVTHLTEFAVSVGSPRLDAYRVWVRCLLDDVRGPFQSVVC